MRGKKRPLNVKAKAVGIAMMTGAAEAARVTGIPERTIQRWVHEPQMAELGARKDEAILAEWKGGAQFAFRRALELLDHTEDPVKAATVGGIIFDKLQLASGGATSRTESRELTDAFSDHELQLLRAAVQREAAATPAPQAAVEVFGPGEPASPEG